MKHNVPYSTWIELDTKALLHNINQYKSIIGNHRYIAAVLKSNAYGHGLRELMAIVAKHQAIHYIAVSTIQEALEVASYHCIKPILVLYPDLLYCVPQALKHNIHFTVAQYDYAQAINEYAKKEERIAFIHLKIDTGMHRFGFSAQNLLECITQLLQLSHVRIEGISTHFSDADNQDPSYTHHQIALFAQTLSLLRKKNIFFPYIHMANSSAALMHQLGCSNMIRIGAGLYGLWASNYVRETSSQRYAHFFLKPVLSWKARIIDIKELPAQSAIGYARTYVTQEKSRIAFLGVGYFEGYHRRLSNCGITMIHNTPAPVVGRVSMNVLIVDISHIPHAQLHDIACLIGADPQISATTIADTITSHNPREVTTRIAAHLPRILV